MPTPFMRLVGCDPSIQQAPIGFAAAFPELPIAVAEAGGRAKGGIGLLPLLVLDAVEVPSSLGVVSRPPEPWRRSSPRAAHGADLASGVPAPEP